MQNRIKTDQEIASMQVAGKMLAQVLRVLVDNVQPGISSKELAQIAASELKSLGGEPAFLGVQPDAKTPPFPDVVCISINEEVQHSIPSNRCLQNGDIVNFDFGVRYQGMITDAGLTVPVGEVKSEVKHLLTQTKRALQAGLAVIKDGVSVRQISSAIEQVLKTAGLGIVKELTGHGVGHYLHEDPSIPNYKQAAPDYILRAGQTIAVEPIATLGSGHIYLNQQDGWTLLSADNTWAAHFEHTVLITSRGCQILTQVN